MEFIEKKLCHCCGKYIELTKFQENKKNKDWLNVKCNMCLEQLKQIILQRWTKKCNCCLWIIALEDFTMNKSTLDWYNHHCKTCKIEKEKENRIKYKRIKTSNITKKIKCNRWDHEFYKKNKLW